MVLKALSLIILAILSTSDFIFKTPSGRVFVFALPYPSKSKKPKDTFIKQKENLKSYSLLQKALATLYHFESDMYENAVVPVALAHKYTSIIDKRIMYGML